MRSSAPWYPLWICLWSPKTHDKVLKLPPNFVHLAPIIHPALTAISVPAHACNPAQPPLPLKIAPATGFPTSKPTPENAIAMPSLVPTVLMSEDSP